VSRYTAPLLIMPLEDGRTFEIMSSATVDRSKFEENGDLLFDLHEFRYEIGHEGSNSFVAPGTGFVTDFASIPRPLWWLLPKWGKYGKAAVIHDFLYRNHFYEVKTALGAFLKVPCGRKRADQIMLEAMEVSNTPKWQQYLIYAGLRIGGWIAWRRVHETR
jgi:hypothetical protein